MGLFSFLFGDDEQEQQYHGSAAAEFNRIKIATPEEQWAIVEPFVQQGIVTPEQAQAYVVEQTALKNILVPGELKEAQEMVLQDLMERASEDGITAEERARMAEIQEAMRAQARGAREAVIQKAHEMGTHSSGLDMMNRLMAEQEAAQEGAARGHALAGMAEQRALQALRDVGEMASAMRGQEHAEQKDVASAIDAIRQFNAEQSQATSLRNAALRQEAQEMNLKEAQRIHEENIQRQYLENVRRGELHALRTEQELARARGVSDVYARQAESARAAQQRRSAGIGGMLTTAGTIIGGIFSDEDTKKNVKEVKPVDVDKLLEDVTGVKYEYRSPQYGPPGQHMGVMADDMKPLGVVVPTSEGDVIDYGDPRMQEAQMAAIASLQQRVKELERRG